MADTQARPAILVVEDNADSAELLCELLEFSGFDATAVFNGTDALGCGADKKWIAVLIDFNLPDMSGAHLATSLREQISPVPLLIATTGHHLHDPRLGTPQKPFDFILSKPFDLDQLLKLLR